MPNREWIDRYVYANLAKKTQRELIQQMVELEERMEKMKCCGNCRHPEKLFMKCPKRYMKMLSAGDVCENWEPDDGERRVVK